MQVAEQETVKFLGDTSQGGGGGYAEGTFGVTAGQVLSVRTGEGGSKTSETNAGGGGFRGAGNSTGTHHLMMVEVVVVRCG